PTPPTPLYSLSLHDALPISRIHLQGNFRIFFYPEGIPDFLQYPFCLFSFKNRRCPSAKKHRRNPVVFGKFTVTADFFFQGLNIRDRKSTRLNSSHVSISYAV